MNGHSSRDTEAALRGGRMTKWKGQVASMAPLLAQTAASLSSLTALTGAMALSSAAPALAQSCTGGGGTYTCAGPGTITTTQSLSSATLPLNVTVNADVGLNVASGRGFNLNASGNGLTFVQQAGGQAIATTSSTFSTEAVRAWLTGSIAGADVSVTTTGAVSSAGSVGVSASARFSNHGDVTVTTNGTVSGVIGIFAQNLGRGVLSVTANDTVQGANHGIIIDRVSNDGENILTTNADVSGNISAILAQINNGATDTTITTNGAVNSLTRSAIYFYEYGTSPAYGDGDFVITTHGDVISRDRFAIEMGINYDYGADTGTETFTIDGYAWGGAGGIHNNRPSAGSTITVTQNGTLGSDAGVAISEGSASLAIAKPTDVVIEGALRGDVTLGLGEDTVTISGGSATLGNIGAALGSAILFDGDNGGTSTNGETDSFTFDNWSGSVDVAQFRNFESFALINGADVTLTSGLGTTLGNLNATNGLAFDIASGSVARILSTLTIDGSVTGGGDISFADGATGAALSVAGDFTGSGGTIFFDTALGDDSSATDMLIVGGDTSGAASVAVNNVGGTGGQTTEGIKIIDVAGASDGAFSLLGDFVTDEGDQALIAGAYVYTVHQGGVSTPGDGDWYLRSMLDATTGPDPTPMIAPTVPAYEGYSALLSALGAAPLSSGRPMPSFRQRAGEFGTAGSDGDPVRDIWLWSRVTGMASSFAPGTSAAGVSGIDYDLYGVEFGGDMVLGETAGGGVLMGGLSVMNQGVRAGIMAPGGKSTADIEGYGITGAVTWYAPHGFYVDAQAQYAWYSSKLSSQAVNRVLTSGLHSDRNAASVELGQRIAFGDGLAVTPHAQLTYSHLRPDGFSDSLGSIVSFGDVENLVLRFGASLDSEHIWTAPDGTESRRRFFASADISYDFLGGSQVTVSDSSGANAATFAYGNDPLWGGIELGGSYGWNGNTRSLSASVDLATSLKDFGDSFSARGNLGFRLLW